jgi:hypothetical protein
MMTEIFAQGDLLLERVPDVSPSGTCRKMLKARRWCWQKARPVVTAMRQGAREHVSRR